MTDEAWRNGSLAQRILHMLDSESMADCTFVVGITEEKKFQCHKLILSHGSPVFYAMFNGGLEEKGEVKVEDIEPQHFKKMLEFIYSDDTELENVESALSVCYAANKYMINTLTLKCIDFIKKNLNIDIVIRALEFARLIDNADLEAWSVQYLQYHTRDVFMSASFLIAERETMLTILTQEHLCVASEEEVFSACIRWAKAQQPNTRVTLREVLGSEMLSLIRFLAMTAEDFAITVVPSKLLEAREESDIFCRLVTGTGNVPQGFNSNAKKRAGFEQNETVTIKAYDEIDESWRISIFCTGKEMNYPFKFSVNTETFISGLELHGLDYDCPEREDTFLVDLLLNHELLASAKFEGLMSAEKYVEVYFKNPFLLQANTEYTLQMKYSNANFFYIAKEMKNSVYKTAAGVEVTVNFEYSTISKIYIAKKFL